jgi:predicted HD superfamily hydrolase involved in NAD metabolism
MGLYGAKKSPPGAAEFFPALSRALDIRRMAHALGVAHTARRLAALHGESSEKAALAGLLHDCAKGLPLARMQAYARENRLTGDAGALACGALLHAAVGAHLAREAYGVREEDVLGAIARHTVGGVPMSPLEMIVYLADKIEPGREDYPQLAKIRSLSQTDLRGAMLLSLEGTVAHVKRQGKRLHPATEKTLLWLREA